MTTFLNILLLLVLINAILLIFSVNRNSTKSKKAIKSSNKPLPTARIYPMDLAPTEYKKAI